MPIDLENDYVTLKEAAKQMNRSYSTVHTYAKLDLLPGAILMWGTRWYVHKDTIVQFKSGEIVIKGAFSNARKRN